MAVVEIEANSIGNEAPKYSAAELNTGSLSEGNRCVQLSIVKAAGQGNGTEMHQFPSADQLLQQFNKDESKAEEVWNSSWQKDLLQFQQQFANYEREVIKELSPDELQTVGKITEDLKGNKWNQLGDLVSQFEGDPERLITLIQMTQLNLKREGLSDKFALSYTYEPGDGQAERGTLSVVANSVEHVYSIVRPSK